MKKLLLTLLFSLLLAPHAASARQQGGADAAAAARRLKLEVSAGKSGYFVGEPLDLTFTLLNVAAAPATGNLCMGLELYNPEVWYRKGGQNFLLFVGNFPAASDAFCAPEVVPVNGNKSHTERLLYVTNPAGFILREPGTYEFRARFKLNDGYGTTLESNVISVEVRPAPEAEREALERWSDPELLDFLQGNEGYAPDEKVRAGMNKAVNFMRGHGGSVYAAPAKKGLLKYLSARAEAGKLTPEEKVIFERLSAEP